MTDLAEDEGLPLTQEQIEAMAKGAVGKWVVQLRESSAEGLPFDELLRAAINEELAAAGMDPLPEKDAQGEAPAATSNQPGAVSGTSTAAVVLTWADDADIDLHVINVGMGESYNVRDTTCSDVHLDGVARREEFVIQGPQTFRVEVQMFTGCGQKENKSPSETAFRVTVTYPDSPGYPGGKVITRDGFIEGEDTIIEVDTFDFQPE